MSYSPNVSYLALWGVGQQWNVSFFPCFPPLKPRCVLWSGASYGLVHLLVQKILSLSLFYGIFYLLILARHCFPFLRAI